MLQEYIIASATFIALLIFFMVISKTVTTIVNQVLKLEYLLKKEYAIKSEAQIVQELIQKERGVSEDTVAEAGNAGGASSAEQASASPPQSGDQKP